MQPIAIFLKKYSFLSQEPAISCRWPGVQRCLPAKSDKAARQLHTGIAGQSTDQKR